MRIGYARVSTRDQNLEMQLDALNQAGCKRIFTDKLSGAQVERPGLKEALSHLREADTLVVWKLDREGDNSFARCRAGRFRTCWVACIAVG
jgi:DNA invertase Pin-like site-specific DNA recombinase